MALTTAQKLALFDILETPYDGSVDKITDEFALSASTQVPTNEDYKVQTKINDRLTAMTSEEEAVLVKFINQWLLIGNNVAMLDAGSVGGVNGVSYDPTNQLMRIQKSVKNIIPVMRYYKEIQLANSSGDGVSVGSNMDTIR